MPTAKPSLFAGTIRQYSNEAIPQLMRMAFYIGILVFFKCPYDANVIKTLESINKPIVRIISFIYYCKNILNKYKLYI